MYYFFKKKNPLKIAKTSKEGNRYLNTVIKQNIQAFYVNSAEENRPAKGLKKAKKT